MLKAAEGHYRRQATLAVAAKRQARRAWETVPLANLDSWQPQRLARIVAALQLTAARPADSYVRAALTEQDTDPQALARTNPVAFAAVAGDGRSLVSLFDEPRIQAKTLIGEGAAAEQAWEFARTSLTRMATTAVQDAGRVAVGVATTARRHEVGQIRMLNPPSCKDCVILAGRWYRWDAGFDRHISCDCIGVPAAEDAAGDLTTDPMEAFHAGHISDLSKADTQALHDGADISRVVNAHRGLSTAGGRKTTTELRAARHGGIRLTPEAIYQAATSRDEALRLLRRFGYLI